MVSLVLLIKGKDLDRADAVRDPGPGCRAGFSSRHLTALFVLLHLEGRKGELM